MLLNLALTLGLIWTVSSLAQPLLFHLPKPLASGLVLALALAVCAAVDIHLVRTLWRALGRGAARETNARISPRRQVAWGLGGVAVVILLVALAAQLANGPLRPRRAAQATADPDTGALVARLPNGGTIELLALSGPNPAPKGWWRPAGMPLKNVSLEVRDLGRVVFLRLASS